MNLTKNGRRTKTAVLFAKLTGSHATAARLAHAQVTPSRITTADGVLEGVISADGKVRPYKGIPYAAPPVGRLRWKAPQPAPAWTGVRKAVEYGARCMQGTIFPEPASVKTQRFSLPSPRLVFNKDQVW